MALTTESLKRDHRTGRAVLLTLCTAIASASFGCVTSGTHEGLMSDYEQSQAELANSRAEVDMLQAALSTATDRGSALEGSVADKERALAELRRRQEQAQARIAQFRDLTARFASMVNAGKLRVSVIGGRMVVQLQTDVLFGSGSAALSRDGTAAIQEVSGLLSSIPGRRYQVEGHTDNVPIKTAAFPSNWELAAARAISVVRVMVDTGMQPERVSAVSYGDTTPIASNETPASREQNRRIEIVVVPDLSQLPGADELESFSRGS